MQLLWYYRDPSKSGRDGRWHEEYVETTQTNNANGVFFSSPFALNLQAVDKYSKEKIYVYPQGKTTKGIRPSLRLGSRGVVNPLWQYNETADPRDADVFSDYGRVYNELIRPNDPIVFIQPGKPKFYGIDSFLAGSGLGVILKNREDHLREAIVKNWNNQDAYGGAFNLESIMNEFAWQSAKKGNPTKFYDFQPDFNSYRAYVKNLCLELMVRMGLTDVEGFKDEIEIIPNDEEHPKLGQDENGEWVVQDADTDPNINSDALYPDSWLITFKNWIKQAGEGSVASTDIFQKYFNYYGWQEQLAAKSGDTSKYKFEAAFIPFRVEKSSSASDQFSNSTGDSMVKDMITSKTEMAKELNFLTRDDNGSYGTNIAGLATKLANIASDVAGSAMGAVSEQAEAIVKTGGNLLFPEIWKDSNYSKSLSLTIKLHAPYGNPKCYFETVLFPTACLLALVMPKQTASAVYISPPLVRCYSKGWFSCDMGMVTDLSISRGQEKNDWTIDRLPRTLEISLTIKDLFGSMMLSMGGSVHRNLSIFSQRNTMLRDYLNVLGGVDAFSDSQFSRRVRNKLTSMMMSVKNVFSSQFWINTAQASPVGRVAGRLKTSAFGGIVGMITEALAK